MWRKVSHSVLINYLPVDTGFINSFVKEVTRNNLPLKENSKVSTYVGINKLYSMDVELRIPYFTFFKMCVGWKSISREMSSNVT